MLRIFDLEDVARAFFAALTSEERITKKVSVKSQLQWKAALDQDILEYLAENFSEKENNDSTESSDLDSLFDERDDNTQGELLSSEQQKLLERLIKEGTKEFGNKKRTRDEEVGDDNGPPTKRQKSDQGKPFLLISFIPCAGTMHLSGVPRITYEFRIFSEPRSEWNTSTVCLFRYGSSLVIHSNNSTSLRSFTDVKDQVHHPGSETFWWIDDGTIDQRGVGHLVQPSNSAPWQRMG